MHDASQHRPVRGGGAGGRAAPLGGRWRAPIGRREPTEQGRRRLVHSVPHAERLVHARVDNKLVEWHLGHPRDHFAEQNEIDVAIGEAPARGCRRRLFRGAPDRFVVSGPRVGQVKIRTQTGHVRQDVADRDAPLAVPAEFRDERRHRIGQADAPILHQHHHRHRRYDYFFGERRHIEDGVDRHRLSHGLEGTAAIGAAEHDRVPAPDEDDRTRQAVRRDGVADDRVDTGQPGEVERWGRLDGRGGGQGEGRGGYREPHCQGRSQGRGSVLTKEGGIIAGGLRAPADAERGSGLGVRPGQTPIC